MKFFKDSVNEKSWAINLYEKEPCLEAVDARTGESIAVLLGFGEDGRIVQCKCAQFLLERRGYNPYEHGNTFDEDGCIEIVKL